MKTEVSGTITPSIASIASGIPDDLPLVSVVMPNLNKAGYIVEAITSILSQDCEDFELLIVDNGSEDQSMSAIQRMAGADSRVRILSEPRRGVSFALNAGVRNARGEFVTFQGSDDVSDERRLSKQVSLMEEKRDAVCYTDGWIIDQKGIPTGQIYNRDLTPLPAKHEGRVFHELVRKDFVMGGTIMVSRRNLANNPFDEGLSFGEDWDFVVRLSRQFELLYVPQPLYGYRVYPGNTWARGNERKFHANYVRIFEKWLRQFNDLSADDRSSILRQLIESQEQLGGRMGLLEVAIRHPGAAPVLLDRARSSLSHRLESLSRRLR